MLTLITGTPGKGKTAMAVKLLTQLAEERPIFCDGIKGLKVPHHPIPHIDDWVTRSISATGSEDYEWVGFPPGALIVIDEAQRFFRPRHVSKAPPNAVAGFETHRQAGLDFIILTQKRTFLDSHIRGLLDVHIHIQDGMLGRFSYTWFREGDPESKADLKEASRKKYSPPREVFELYQSAELHTKPKREKPLIMYVGAISAILFVILAYRVINSVSSRGNTVAESAKPDGAKPISTSNQASSEWHIVGWLEGQYFRIVISNGTHQRIVPPASFKRIANDIEATLEDGTVVTSWNRTPEKKKHASPFGT